jgi:hypothetical protein
LFFLGVVVRMKLKAPPTRPEGTTESVVSMEPDPLDHVQHVASATYIEIERET